MNGLILMLAQGLGAGRIPAAPGTWGSLVGVGWFLLLVATGNFWMYLVGMLAGIGASVWICGEAERILGRRDPGSVVWDELCVMPLALLPLVWVPWETSRGLPTCGEVLGGKGWIGVLVGFGLFRLFDVTKPGWVGRSQGLPGGWGVTMDDVLAALCTAAILGVARYFG